MSGSVNFHGSHKTRMRRLLRPNGRTFIVAMDHLSRPGGTQPIRDPQRVLAEIAAADADAVLLRHGTAVRHAEQLGRMALVLSLNHEDSFLEQSIRLALRLGADAVKVVAFPGSIDLASSVPNLGLLAAQCDQWAIPLIAEMIPVSFEAKQAHTATNIASAARLGSDLGCDLVKTKYTGDQKSFSEVVRLAHAPVVVLGGADGDIDSLFKSVREALDAGAVGAAVGRKVWQSEVPGRIAGALARLVHEDVSVKTAIREASRVTLGPRKLR
jgi:DhnA family fructose-bisphosphate aldolase class Ia